MIEIYFYSCDEVVQRVGEVEMQQILIEEMGEEVVEY
jgi:hypothetical protein